MGKIATTILGCGKGWSAGDVICRSGPQDRPFVEEHSTISIAAVVEGSFQYRSDLGSQVLSPGSLLLGNLGHSFECRHEHGTGDRCLAFRYTQEFFDRAELTPGFPIPSIPPIRALSPWIAETQLGTHFPHKVLFEELAYELAGAVMSVLETNKPVGRAPTAADERRVSAALRFIEANLSRPMPLEVLAANARMSEFHFLRVFRQVTRVTPHQYILRSRLREAAFRLRAGSDDVLDIALDTGFHDLSNFNHVFRAEFGVNPSGFRR